LLYAGISEWSAAQIEEAMRIADKYLLDRFFVNQPQYSMLYRNIEAEVIHCQPKARRGAGVFSPLAQGLLTGKYKSVSDIPADSRAAISKLNRFIGGLLTETTTQ
jgi:aryl-alcohol dehydrogenase-like predicted oxidoreductase